MWGVSRTIKFLVKWGFCSNNLANKWWNNSTSQEAGGSAEELSQGQQRYLCRNQYHNLLVPRIYLPDIFGWWHIWLLGQWRSFILLFISLQYLDRKFQNVFCISIYFNACVGMLSLKWVWNPSSFTAIFKSSLLFTVSLLYRGTSIGSDENVFLYRIYIKK